MPYAHRNLSVLAYANGFTLWHYRAGTELANVKAPGFFNDASHLSADDLIMVTSKAGAQIVFVTHAVEGAVVVAPLC